MKFLAAAFSIICVSCVHSPSAQANTVHCSTAKAGIVLKDSTKNCLYSNFASTPFSPQLVAPDEIAFLAKKFAHVAIANSIPLISTRDLYIPSGLSPPSFLV